MYREPDRSDHLVALESESGLVELGNKLLIPISESTNPSDLVGTYLVGS